MVGQRVVTRIKRRMKQEALPRGVVHAALACVLIFSLGGCGSGAETAGLHAEPQAGAGGVGGAGGVAGGGFGGAGGAGAGGVGGTGGVGGAGGALAGAGGVGGTAPSQASFPSVTDFAATGPFSTVQKSEGPSCTIHRPGFLGTGGVGEGALLHPIILWGNGTTATPPIYAPALRHWASHGFVVAAANTSNAGTGRQMIACLDFLVEEHQRAGSDYFGKLDLARVGASGHSQGGGGSIMVGADPRVSVTAPLQPFVTGLGHDSAKQSQQTGPMFLMSGGLDVIASRGAQQQPVFNNVNTPVFWGTLKTGDHVVTAVGDIGGYRGPATAWFRLHLMDDENARPWFYGADCVLCQDDGWEIEKRGLP